MTRQTQMQRCKNWRTDCQRVSQVRDQMCKWTKPFIPAVNSDSWIVNSGELQKPERTGQFALFLLLNHLYCNELSGGSQSVRIRPKCSDLEKEEDSVACGGRFISPFLLFISLSPVRFFKHLKFLNFIPNDKATAMSSSSRRNPSVSVCV